MPLQRSGSLSIGGTTVNLPCFFPSVSSVKTNLMPVDYVELLSAATYPLWLASALDIAACDSETGTRMMTAFSAAKSQGTVVLLDSGNYESFWKADETWTADRFHGITASWPHQLCFCFDNQRPPACPASTVEEVVARVVEDQKHSAGTVLPIVHGNSSTLPEISYGVAQQLYPLMLAVPERALGDGIINRIRNVRRIRDRLDTLNQYCPLHLLGTGNPVSIAAYALAGADSFDGLEWCQTVVDHSSGMLSHFQHFDFVRDQTKWGSESSLPFTQTVLMHNLELYRQYKQDLHDAVFNPTAALDILARFASKERIDLILSAIQGNEDDAR